MRLSEMTAVLATSEETKLTCWWLGFSHLESGKARIQLPLAENPYIKSASDVSKGILARKTKQGRWRFEVVERKEWDVPAPKEDAPRLGVDVGLNVMVATSEGDLLGTSLKPKFNALHKRVCEIRANRQRQGFKDNSPRLDKLEGKLTGLVKTMSGEVANKLVASHPDTIFVIEDLDLRECKGAKRFAYRALHHSLKTKAQCEFVNPAYSSQTCPSCGYVSRKNRSGIKFTCRSCGRTSHADAVGGLNLLGRSEDKQIQLDDHPSAVKALLRERFRARCRTSSSGKLWNAPAPSGQKLTTEGSGFPGIGTASNQVVALT
jgi:putative transposase